MKRGPAGSDGWMDGCMYVPETTDRRVTKQTNSLFFHQKKDVTKQAKSLFFTRKRCDKTRGFTTEERRGP